MRGEREARRAIERYGDMVRRICTVELNNHADSEDVFQTVFLKYVLSAVSFENEEHEKAWLIRVSVNACRDVLRSAFRRRTVSLSALGDIPADVPEEHREVLGAVASLPEKYRVPVYLYYYEGYSAGEIGALLGKNPNTVYTLLSRARGLLREKLGGDEDG